MKHASAVTAETKASKSFAMLGVYCLDQWFLTLGKFHLLRGLFTEP